MVPTLRLGTRDSLECGVSTPLWIFLLSDGAPKGKPQSGVESPHSTASSQGPDAHPHAFARLRGLWTEGYFRGYTLAIASVLDGAMHTRPVRALVLACGLLLPLPHGWCCMIPHKAATVGSPACVVPVRDCCGHCTRPLERSPHHPLPLPADKCPCGDRRVSLPLVAKVLVTDAVVAAPVPIDVLAPGMERSEPLLSPVTKFHLHSRCLLLCCWLC
jgi:hypothetical protein